MTTTEIRSIPSGKLEVRSTDGKRTLYGIAAPFNSLSQPLGGPGGNFRETIKPGAFSKTLLSRPDVRLTADHDLSVGKILARTPSTMTLREGSTGLELEAQLGASRAADDIIDSIGRGDVDGLSISFRVDPDGDTWEKASGGVVRTLRSVTLGPEISIVATPAYKATAINLRSCPEEFRSLLNVTDDEAADFARYAALQLALAALATRR